MLEQLPSILVVDDDDDVREVIRTLLDNEGFTVATAASVWEALDLIEAREFDLAVVDVRLRAELDGIDLVQCIRARQTRLRALFISGLAHPVSDDPDRDDFVSKPFHPHELLGCVWELLHRKVPESAFDWPERHANRVMLLAKIECLRQRRGHRAAETEAEAEETAARRVGTRRASGRGNSRK